MQTEINDRAHGDSNRGSECVQCHGARGMGRSSHRSINRVSRGLEDEGKDHKEESRITPVFHPGRGSQNGHAESELSLLPEDCDSKPRIVTVRHTTQQVGRPSAYAMWQTATGFLCGRSSAACRNIPQNPQYMGGSWVVRKTYLCRTVIDGDDWGL